MILCAAAFATLLATGGLDHNHGPGVEGENIMLVLCSRGYRNLNSGTKFETRGQ